MDFEHLKEPGAADYGREGAIVLATAIGMSAFIDGLLLMLALRLARRKGAQIPRYGYLACVFFALVIAQVTATANTGMEMRFRALGRYIKENG